MAKKTIYCVQAYAGGKREFIKGVLREFNSQEGATAAALDLARRVPGVLVFSVTGDPAFDCWDDPVIVKRIGRLPATARCAE